MYAIACRHLDDCFVKHRSGGRGHSIRKRIKRIGRDKRPLFASETNTVCESIRIREVKVHSSLSALATHSQLHPSEHVISIPAEESGLIALASAREVYSGGKRNSPAALLPSRKCTITSAFDGGKPSERHRGLRSGATTFERGRT